MQRRTLQSNTNKNCLASFHRWKEEIQNICDACGQVASIEHTSTTLRDWIKTSHNSKPTNPILADCSLNKRNCQENRRWWGGFLSSKDVSDHNKWILTIPMILTKHTKCKIRKEEKCLVGSGLVVTGGTKKKVMMTTTRDCQNSSCFSDTTWHKRNIQMHKNDNSNGYSMSVYSNHNRRMQIFLTSVFSCSLATRWLHALELKVLLFLDQIREGTVSRFLAPE